MRMQGVNLILAVFQFYAMDITLRKTTIPHCGGYVHKEHSSSQRQED